MTKSTQHPEPKIPYSPKIRQVYWCKFPETEFSNEFGSDGKRRPVVIFSKKNRRYGTVVVVPLSTAKQRRPESSVKMKSPLDGKDTWAVCTHPMTVSTHRLCPDRNGVPLVQYDDFQDIKQKVFRNLPD